MSSCLWERGMWLKEMMYCCSDCKWCVVKKSVEVGAGVDCHF